jgi:hypothetical protein
MKKKFLQKHPSVFIHCRQRRQLVRTSIFLIAMFFSLLSLTLSAQTKTISGSVKDEKGQPLSGVSVVVKETKIGTTTNTSGQFSLTAPITGTLVFSYVGYSRVEMPIGNSLSYDITLKAGGTNSGSEQIPALVIITQPCDIRDQAPFLHIAECICSVYDDGRLNGMNSVIRKISQPELIILISVFLRSKTTE